MAFTPTCSTVNKAMDASDDAAIAAKRAEIAARVAAARAQQEQQQGSGKKALSRKEMKAALEEDGGSSKTLSRKDRSAQGRAKAAHEMPSAEQLRRQAKEMSRNPELVRRANPEMRSLTDAQIRQHAKEMEKMAANPELIQTMAKVQSMPESERAALLQLQEGLAGKVSRDDKWISETIRLVKSQPDTLKKLFKGKADSPLNEKQLEGIVDYVVTCSDGFLTSAVHLINWAIRMSGPAGRAYRVVDGATLGGAKYLLLIGMLVSLFYVGKAAWYLLTLAVGLLTSGYVRLMGGGSAAAAGAEVEAVDPAEAARPDDVDAPFVEL